MNIIECFSKAIEEKKLVKRLSWDTWLDPKKIYISHSDVLADDWEIKTDSLKYWVGINKDGIAVEIRQNGPFSQELKWTKINDPRKK